MGKFKEYYEARNKLVEIVKEDLVGPVTEDEVIMEMPTAYYIMGKLYPDTNDIQDDDDLRTSADLEMLDMDNALAATNVYKPRSMGVTYSVLPDVDYIRVKIRFAMYLKYSLEEAEKENLNISRYKDDIEEMNENKKGRICFWKRDNKEFEYKVSTCTSSNIEILPDIRLRTFVHLDSENNNRIITTTLTNERKCKEKEQETVAENTVMQAEVRLLAEPGINTFVEVGRQLEIKNNPELLELDMLYSQETCYAQGHGCSVNWDNSNSSPAWIESSFMPEYNLCQMKPKEIKDNPVFNMKYLYTAEHDEIIMNLNRFMDEYNAWISEKESDSKGPQYNVYADIAGDNLDKCRNIEARIRHAISLLADGNSFAWRAFRLANEAMYMQRYKSIEKQNSTNGVTSPIDDTKINWYPFQLAFMIMEIPSFVEPDGADRKIVDLLWFPTGGGKTEAYLGIAAFEIFYRILSNPDKCNGVSVIMRYTLRLLTIQQFERASILICACELLRKRYDLPGDEISIGLWVGNKFTPGSIDDAERALNAVMVTGKAEKDKPDPCQIKICPWCGSKLYPKQYKINKNKVRMEIRCENQSCDYHGVPLPIRIIDEEIYHYRPAFIVATVDKFAQIAIQERTSALFSADGIASPPELIIQDELHLISGPLGTMTGIYEAAITSICESLGKPVKVVASTATIRNATKQIQALYAREYNQFPPQGISYDNSFFAVKSSEEERPARHYVGIMGTGITFTSTVIRLYAAWLFASRYLIDLGYSDEVIDNSWTLTGYFNSIRELGATQTQVVDDIQSRYRFLKGKKFKEKYPNFTGNDRYERLVELTSRMPNEEISEVIQEKLKVPFVKGQENDVYDFVLASNMISVGVDVGRLGVMAVAGQPKTNAEYIQATSRVGRSNPGLVFTVYNGCRSRDRSHYEQFLKYHFALYRYVEATSLTPFSDRARDRGLQALFVTLCRYLCPELREDNAAGKFKRDLDGVIKAQQIIYKYVERVDDREKQSVMDELNDIVELWELEAERYTELWYKKMKKQSLLQPDTDENSRFRIMNSMRSVEPSSGIYLM